MNPLYSIIVAVFILFSCSSEKPAATAARDSSDTERVASGANARYALELDPREPTRKTTINLRPVGFDLSNAKIEWFVNGKPFTTLQPAQFSGADAAKGDTLQAKAVISGREVMSDVVEMVNAPPELTRVKILPEVFKPGDVLNVEAEATDIDDDKVDLLYKWTKNGELAGKDNRIAGAIKRGDSVSVTVTPYDGESYGRPVTVKYEIRNFPPMVMENTEFSFDGKLYTYQVKATDPDGDALSYVLEAPPTGMTIDTSTGLLRWSVPPEFKGSKDVSINVSDGNGGNASYRVTIIIQ